MLFNKRDTLAPEDAPLALAEHALWMLVAARGPCPELVKIVESALNGQTPPGKLLDDDQLCDLWEQLYELYQAGQAGQTKDVLSDSFELAGLVWQAYQDGFKAGVASVVATDGGLAMSSFHAPVRKWPDA